MPILTCRDLTKTFSQDGCITPVLRGISLDIAAGEFVAIMGPSGSGKSTLLHCLGLLEAPTSGSLSCLDRDAAGLSDRAKAEIRRQSMGFVFQAFYLVPGLTVLENVLLPMLIRHQPGSRDQAAAAMLRQVGLDHRAGHRPSQLSGGEQQRVALARALVGKPRLLFLDEPTGNLDTATGSDILKLVQEINRTAAVTTVMVTHDSQAAARCDRIIRIRDGLIADG